MNKFRIIDFLRGTNIVGEFKNYCNIFNDSSANLLEIQKNNLTRFLKELKKHNFFMGYLKDFSIVDIEKEPFKVHKTLPITDKEFIAENFNSILNKNLGKYEHHYTGGSTGTPFKYAVDKKTISHSRAFNYFLWNRFLGYTFGDKIIVIAGTSLGTNAGIKKKIYNYLQDKYFFSGDLITKETAESLTKFIKNNPNRFFIYGYPSSISAYIELLDKDDKDLKKKVKGVITTSEMLHNNEYEKIEKFFDAKVLNIYGAIDGSIMSGSIDNRHFFYNGVDCYVESIIIDDHHELLLTNLNSRVFPFVRYSVSDMAKINYNSLSPLPFVLTELIGRTRDFLFNQNKEKVHGSLINKVLKNYSSIIQYQIEQEKDYSCKIYLKTKYYQDIASIKPTLIDKLKVHLGRNIKIEIEYSEKFFRTKSGKHQIIISHVN